MALTNLEIKNLKPAAKAVDTADENGLYIRVYPSGTKSFMYRSRVGGKARWMALGNYPALTLSDARTQAAALADGQLPENVTVKFVYDEWFAKAIKPTYKSPAQVTDRLDLHLIPKFGTDRVASLTRAKLSQWLTDIAKTAPYQANRVLTDVKLMLEYAVGRGWLEINPAEKITQKVVGGKEKSRTRVMDHAEVTNLIIILRTNWNPNTNKTSRFDGKTRLALAIALLTGQRSGNVRTIRKSIVHGRNWVIPAKETKTGLITGEDMHIYMPYAASYAVRLAFKLYGDVPFDGMEGQALSHATRYMKFATRTTPHDFRRTMRTRMADLKVLPHVGEKCLDHVLGGVLAIYDRGEYADEKKAAWRLWAKYLLGKRKAPGL